MSVTRDAPPCTSPTVARGGVGWVVVAVLALYLIFVGARLAAFDGDVSGFVTAGDRITDVARAPEGLHVSVDVDGYDGQAYYRLARAPLTDEVSDHGIAFTRPAYWQTRIGYPATAWLLAVGGQPSLVPLALLVVNLLAVAGLVLLGARLARDLGRSPWWGAVPALWAGYLVGVGQDLTEPLAGFLLLAGLVALRAGRWWPATIALTAAGLTRETTLLVAVVVLGTTLWLRYGVRDGRRGAPTAIAAPWWVGALALVVYAGWRTWVRGRWADIVPDPPGDNPLTLPLGSLLGYLDRAREQPGPEWANLVLLLPTLLALVVAATALRRRDALLHERLALAGYLLVLLCLPVWDRGQAYLRWGCEPVLLGWLVLLGHGRRTDAVAAGAAGRASGAQTGRPRSGALLTLAAVSAVVWVVTATQSVGYPRTDGPWNGLWTWS